MRSSVEGTEKEIVLQDRDRALLRFIEEQGFVTYRQIYENFFPTMPSCSRRISQLVHTKYIQEESVKNLLCIEREGSIYFPHLQNLDLKASNKIYYINRNFSRAFGKSKKLFKRSMIMHQLILNDIRSFLVDRIQHKYLLNDPKISILSAITGKRPTESIPDLSLEFGDIKIAVEVERSLKTNHEYRSKVFNFERSCYSHVLYFYTNENILRKLMQRTRHSSKFGFAHYAQPNDIFSPVWGILDVNSFIHKVKLQRS